MSNYVEQLKEFKSYMNACLEVLMWEGDDVTTDVFYNSPFEITFRGKKVTLSNGAEVFQAIEEIIQTEIDNEEGC